MKMQIAAICYTERELDNYVSQLKSQGFESLSEVKKAEDGSFYLVMAKASKFDTLATEKTAVPAAEAITA